MLTASVRASTSESTTLPRAFPWVWVSPASIGNGSVLALTKHLNSRRHGDGRMGNVEHFSFYEKMVDSSEEKFDLVTITRNQYQKRKNEVSTPTLPKPKVCALLHDRKIGTNRNST